MIGTAIRSAVLWACWWAIDDTLAGLFGAPALGSLPLAFPFFAAFSFGTAVGLVRGRLFGIEIKGAKL